MILLYADEMKLEYENLYIIIFNKIIIIIYYLHYFYEKILNYLFVVYYLFEIFINVCISIILSF